MKSANVAEIKDHLSHFLALVQHGETIQICKRNIPVARIVPNEPFPPANQTQLGCGRQTGRIKGDLTEPAIPTDSWDMLAEQ